MTGTKGRHFPVDRFIGWNMLRELERALRGMGGRHGLVFEPALQGWQELTASLSDYPASIDDYTYDLYVRELLGMIIERVDEPRRKDLAATVQAVDDQFLAATEPDPDGVLASFVLLHHVDDSPGFWWRRLPRGGHLAEYLRESADRERAKQARWQAFADGRSIHDPET